MVEIPKEVEIGPIKLTPGETFYYTAWGIRYRFKGGNWQVADMVFHKRSDAIDWMERNYLKFEGMEGEAVPVKRCLELTTKGHTKAWTEELG